MRVYFLSNMHNFETPNLSTIDIGVAMMVSNIFNFLFYATTCMVDVN